MGSYTDNHLLTNLASSIPWDQQWAIEEYLNVVHSNDDFIVKYLETRIPLLFCKFSSFATTKLQTLVRFIHDTHYRIPLVRWSFYKYK